MFARNPTLLLWPRHAAAAKGDRDFSAPWLCVLLIAVAAGARAPPRGGVRGPSRPAWKVLPDASPRWHTTTVSPRCAASPFRGAAARCGHAGYQPTRLKAAASCWCPASTRRVSTNPGWSASRVSSRGPRPPGAHRRAARISCATRSRSRTTDMIEDAAAWMMRRAEYHGRDGRIGTARYQLRRRPVDRRRRAAVDSQWCRVRDGARRPRGSPEDAPSTRAPASSRTARRVPRTTTDSRSCSSPPRIASSPRHRSRRCREAIRSFLEASRLDMIDKAKGGDGVRAREGAGV